MELSPRILILSLLVCAVPVVWADNPYQSIVNRNAFGLNPPPLPAPPAPPPPPPDPVPLPVVRLTGITTITKPPKAIFEIQEPGGKEIIKPRPLPAGAGSDGITVISIDIASKSVNVGIGDITTNITFEVAKLSAPPPTPRGPAQKTRSGRTIPVRTGAVRTSSARTSTAARTYNVGSRTAASSRTAPSARSTNPLLGGGTRVARGISVSGGTPVAPSTSYGGAAAAGLPTPTRPVRSTGLTREQALELLKMQRAVPPPPLPPIQR